ncbi:MAG: hypothetical protein FWG72_10780 [Oscillospiraceae bacterium]|nr:hypothetical protein [Oscillospiraceae bacterium]
MADYIDLKSSAAQIDAAVEKIENLPPAEPGRNFTTEPIQEGEINPGAVTDSRIGTRSILENPPRENPPSITAKNHTTWLQQFRDFDLFVKSALTIHGNHISDAEDAITALEQLVNGFVGLPEWDADEYTLTFTTQDGEKLVIDLPLEGLTGELGLDFDPATSELVFVKADGTEIRVPLTDLIDVYEGSTGDNIQITTAGNTIRATLLTGTVGYNHLTAALRELIDGKASQDDLTALEQEVSDAVENLNALAEEQRGLAGKVWVDERIALAIGSALQGGF